MQRIVPRSNTCQNRHGRKRRGRKMSVILVLSKAKLLPDVVKRLVKLLPRNYHLELHLVVLYAVELLNNFSFIALDGLVLFFKSMMSLFKKTCTEKYVFKRSHNCVVPFDKLVYFKRQITCFTNYIFSTLFYKLRMHYTLFFLMI